MNVSCGQCQTVYRVDPLKVPEGGVRARCSVCAGIFWVRKETTEAAGSGQHAPGIASAPVAQVPPPAPQLPSSPAPSSISPVFPGSPQASPVRPPPPAPAVAPQVPAAPPPSYRPAAPPAPAFRPAAAQVAPAAAAPAPIAAPMPVTAAPSPPRPAPAAPAPRRPTNPFLSQDPEARARRLARALVSDIVVYHPAKRRDALRDGSLKLLFEEEIRKSWEEYVDQVGRELADSTSFFTDALNEILADGQPVFP